MFSQQDQDKLAEIIRLLDEAYEHYFRLSDGHCKSSEGYVSVSFHNYFDRKHDGKTGAGGVEVYSYVLGPNRTHYFDSLDDALGAVRQWHKAEMEQTY